MSYSRDTPIRGTTNVSAGQAVAYARFHGATAEYEAYLRAVWRFAPMFGINPLAVAGQWADETGTGTSERWQKGDPAGIGIFGPGTPSTLPPNLSGEQSAAIHIAELASKINGSIVSEVGGIQIHPIDPHLSRVDQFINRSDWPDINTLQDLRIPLAGGDFTWAENQNYGIQIANHMNNFQAFADEHPDRGTPSTMVRAIECEITLDPLQGDSNNRPQLEMADASYVTVHEVGNTSPGADEFMHRDFVHNGGGENQVSFHFVVGPTKVFQLVYLNENAWHASDGFYGRGNRDTIAIETIQIGDFDKTLGHLAYLIAEIYRNPSRFAWRNDFGRIDDLNPSLVKERTKQHNFWAPDKKNCPQFMRERGLWIPLLDGVAAELSGNTPAPVKQYSDPILPRWWNEKAVSELRLHVEDGVKYRPLGTRVQAVKKTGAYAHGYLPEAKGKRTRPDIKRGEAVDIRYIYNIPNTDTVFGITKFGTHVAMEYMSPGFTIIHAR